ncbi:phage terminase large subunit [Ovoidimarina sediminis]|uniref:phage terminase large subunit n=1 Tax=Ovoidimarina sediminis TaxID=3079856 RepID=UPI00290A8107|nr:phage terminase large subunit [Rhodophyticola sp. MJ-SS7]MDU8944306.1 phage terminase large subunit [Rhodophyticola sp. MJ-SS7]
MIQCWQITDGNIYLLGSSRGRWAFPELRKRALLLKKPFSADFFLIENASSGRALAQELQGLIPPEQRSHVVQTYTPKDSKEVRMDLAMVPIAAGKVYLPDDAEWLPELIRELLAFPSGANDDQVDGHCQTKPA